MPEYEPSTPAKMWVQIAKDFGKVIKLLPEEDRPIALELFPVLWSEYPNEVSAAEHTLYEIIDKPKGEIVGKTKIGVYDGLC